MSHMDKILKKIGLARIKMLNTIVSANMEDSDCWTFLTKNERKYFKQGLKKIVSDLDTAIIDWKI